MAMSPLTMAMLGGNVGMQDPAYLPALRRLQVGQQMAATGSDVSPAYPLQGLARALTAIPGAYLMLSGENQFNDITSGRQKAATDALDYMRGGASPLASALTGPPPQTQVAPPERPAPTQGADAAAGGIANNARNNPLNLRFAGQDGATNVNGFAAFPSQQAGLDAADKQMGLYAQRGINTLRGLISTWAPPNENNTEAYIKSVSSATGIDPDKPIDLTNPAVTAPIKQAMSVVENGAQPTQVAQAGNIATDAGPQVGPRQGAAPAQQPVAPQTGVHAPNVQQGMEMLRRAQEMAVRNPYNPAIQEAAKMAAQQAQILMGLDTFVPTTQNGVQGQLNSRTGEFKPLFTAAPRFATGPHGETIVGSPGGAVTSLNNNPSGMKAGTPEQIIAEIGPKIQNGTATDQERANYTVAAEQFQKFKTQVNPTDNSITRIPEQPLPGGMPQSGMAPPAPSAAPADEAGGKSAMPSQAQAVQHGPEVSPTGVQKLTPGGPPQAAVDKRYDDFHKLETTALGARDELQQAALLKQTMHELGSTGPATPFLANLSRYAAQAGVPEETIKKFGLPPGATETQAAALANALVMEIARAGFPQRITNNDLQFAASVKPNPGQPLSAADFLIDNTIVPRAQRDIERYGSVVNLTNPQHGDYEPTLGSMPSKLFDFDKAHPLSSYTPKLGGGSPGAQASQGNAPPPATAVAQPAAPASPATPTRADIEAEMKRRGLLK